jgi:Na+-driven multidrug efflux pump
MVAMGSALRGTGNFKPGMIVQTTTVVVNMVLAPILIFGWFTGYPMGVAGAAISTLVAVVVGVLWLSRYFTSGNEFLHFRWADWPPRFETWASMLKIGLPAGAEFALTAVYLFIVYTVCRPFGRRRRRRSVSGYGSCSRCSCRSWPSPSPLVRSPARTSARARPIASARRSCQRWGWRWRERRSRG